MTIPQTPIFVKTHDFILWLLKRTQRFPKNMRHSYTNRLETLAFDFEQALITANTNRGRDRLAQLHVADTKLACLRLLVRYAYDLEMIAGNQLAFVSRQIDEIGRLLGAWIKGSSR